MTAGAADHPVVLFSSFEPSGDALSAHTIAALGALSPSIEIHALGGPRMEAAGAALLENTIHRASMFLETTRQIRSHRARLRRLRGWLADHPIDLLVPVDSPAANWSICRAVRRACPRARIVHLVAPQLWAWASWRIGRLRRLTDHVLCLLPFEPAWLANRGVRATFVGHPAFDTRPRDEPQGLPSGRPRLALLPGSRTSEVTRNWPTMLEAFARLHRARPDLCGAVAALDGRIEALLREAAGPSWPQGLAMATGCAEAVQEWCDLALVASGTATLQLAARRKPMVVMYNMGRLSVIVGRLLVRTRTFTLPNLVSEWAGFGRAVPELVPHHGQVEPVVRAILGILDDPAAAERQRVLLGEIAARFAGSRFEEAAPRELLAALNGATATARGLPSRSR